MELDEPRRPVIRDVREDRDRPDQVERPGCERQGRLLAVREHVQRWAQVGLEPRDARRVDVRAVEGAALGLLEEVAKSPSRPAAEVENVLSRERPVRGQHSEYLGADGLADLVVLDQIVPVERSDALGELARWEGCLDRHRRQPSQVGEEGACVDRDHRPAGVPLLLPARAGALVLLDARIDVAAPPQPVRETAPAPPVRARLRETPPNARAVAPGPRSSAGGSRCAASAAGPSPSPIPSERYRSESQSNPSRNLAAPSWSRSRHPVQLSTAAMLKSFVTGREGGAR